MRFKTGCGLGGPGVDYESAGEEVVSPVLFGGLPVTGFHASHVSCKGQSVMSKSGCDAQEQDGICQQQIWQAQQEDHLVLDVCSCPEHGIGSMTGDSDATESERT